MGMLQFFRVLFYIDGKTEAYRRVPGGPWCPWYLN